MPRITYQTKRFSAGTKAVIGQAITILDEYAGSGYDLTLRQLYYQFVARGLIANKQAEYSRLGSIINDARMAGYIDWHAIVDRTRNLRGSATWESPESIIRSAANGYAIDKWAAQPERVEVWIEKDALVGVISRACQETQVDYFSCRGYTSQSEMWSAAQRIGGHMIDGGKSVTILHLGDHDPSGIDMTRDIEDRLSLFLATDYFRTIASGRESNVKEVADAAWDFVNGRFHVHRIALNMAQVEEHDPPPNPAKMTDSRFEGYIAEHGDESWELDALPPDVLADLVRDHVSDHLDHDLWERDVAREAEQRDQLLSVSSRWQDVVSYVEDGDDR